LQSGKYAGHASLAQPAKSYQNQQHLWPFGNLGRSTEAPPPGSAGHQTPSADRQNVLFTNDTSAQPNRFGGDLMPSTQTGLARTHLTGQDFARTDSSTDWRSLPVVSDDECIALLAKAVEDHDPESLDEVAWLIGRLAVPIE
jgi:hypothetical protein